MNDDAVGIESVPGDEPDTSTCNVMLGRDVFIKKSAPYRARRVCYDRKERIPFLRFGFAFTKLTFSGARVCPPKPNDVIEIVIDDPYPRIWD